MAAALKTLEVIAAAEPHQARARCGQICQNRILYRRGHDRRLSGYIVAETIARQAESINDVHDRGRIEPCVLVIGVVVIDCKGQLLRCPLWKVRAGAVVELKILATILWVSLGIVGFNKSSGSPN